MKRFRIKYAKKEALKYTSGLEVQKLWERSLRRGHFPVAYSQGFHPQPRINQAAPLPLGFTSYAEWMDIWFQDELQLERLSAELPLAMPPGIEILEVREIPLSAATLQNNVVSVTYRVILLQPVDRQYLAEGMQKILNSATLPRIRREKEYDLRPLIEELSLPEAPKTTEDWPEIIMKLAARPGATGRPEEVLAEMGLDPLETRIEKIDMFFGPDFI